MSDRNKNNTSSGKHGRFDIPVPTAPIDNTNNTSPANTTPPKNRFGTDSPDQTNFNTAPKRPERFNDNNDFTGTATPHESKFDIKKPAGIEPHKKNLNNGKFTIEPQNNESQQSQFDNDNNTISMQTMQIKQTTTQQPETTKTTVNTLKKYLLPIDSQFEWLRLSLLLFLILPLTIYSYYPAIKQIVYNWTNNVDYSHGFFVIPLVGLFI
jgi:hypothetical protein